jgi:hypothetical protein
MTDTLTENQEALEEVEREFCLHLSPEFKYENIKFNEGGLARYGSIVGFIMGMKLAGKVEEAAELAKHFKSIFKYLSTYGGETEVVYDGIARKHPACIIQLGDDGCANSFNVLWYTAPEVVSYGSKPEHGSIIVGNFPTLRYKFSFNGGLIFHGFNNETWSVRLGDDSNPWSIHT